MSLSEIDYVVFDLGGVLVRLGGVTWLQELAGAQDENEAWSTWLRCPWVRTFERGECSAEEFATGLWGCQRAEPARQRQPRSWPAGSATNRPGQRSRDRARRQRK